MSCLTKRDEKVEFDSDQKRNNIAKDCRLVAVEQVNILNIK
jgi:hypothetical protein